MDDKANNRIDINTIIGIESMQSIQDSFSNAMNLASVIASPNGTPITQPSNFSQICTLIRSTEQGLKNCKYSDASLGNTGKDAAHHLCLSAGLCDGSANIYIGEQKVAVWLIGQVITEGVNERKIIEYATSLGITREEAIEALKTSTHMPIAQFEKILLSLSVFANQLSKSAYQNSQLLLHQENLEGLVKEKTHDLKSAFDELSDKNEELISKNKLIENQNQELKATLKDLKEAELQLVQAEKMASLGILTAGVAHEINNPLNFISSSHKVLEMIYKKGKISENTDKIKVLLDSLKEGVERTSKIVASLNQFSRNNSSVTETCNLHSIIENSLVMVQNQTKHRIDIEKKFTSSKANIIGNLGRLNQVFLNIISNAIQAIEESGKITIRTKNTGTMIEVSVTDNGIGIAPKDLRRIKDPFFTTKAPGQGTGLGLSISHSIIKEHHGELEIDSQLGKGTSVSIKLPITNVQHT